MQWVKKGHIFCADHTNAWALSYAAIPTPHQLNDQILRIYCAFRAGGNVSRIGYVDVLAENPQEILGVSPVPVLDIGEPGMFDDNGVVPTSIVSHENKLYLYYGGFQLGSHVPYFMFGGLAISHDGGQSFTRCQRTPIIDRSDSEPFFRTAQFVLNEGNTWKKWYVAGDRWIEHNGKKLPFYSMKYLESRDGVHWGEEGYVCFEPHKDEHGFGRPYVFYEQGLYKMFYSIRSLSRGYRLGYAESSNGKDWIRKDHEMGLDISDQGWDSEAVCYCARFAYRGKTYLFYNGNNYGETGFGYAELVT